MVRSVLMGVSSLLLSVLLTCALVPKPLAAQPRREVLIVESQPAEEETLLRLSTEQGVRQLTLQEYLVGVLLAEMPSSFGEEAMKAQVIAARTYTLRKLEQSKHETFDLCSQSACCQAWIDGTALAEKLGSAWQASLQKAQKAVDDTEGKVLLYGGSLIEAVYFSCSGGMTEDAAAVWGSEVPYLKPVMSPGEDHAPRALSQVRVPLSQFQQLLTAENPAVSLGENSVSWFGTVIKTPGDGVYAMEIGGERFLGTRLRSLFGLNSTRFTVAVEADAVVFEVSGFGHRVGMSQYGANAMAESGKTCEEILLHYYSGAEIGAVPNA